MKSPLHGASVVLDGQVVALEQGAQLGGSLQQIGQVAEGVLEGLGGVVGHVGKGAEGGHIDEKAVVEHPNVAGAGHAGHGGFGGLVHAFGQVQVPGEVIGGAGGDVAHQGGRLQAHQAGDHLVEGSVAAAAYHPVVPAADGGGHPSGVAGSLGGPGAGQVPCLGEGVQNGGELGAYLALARLGIVDKKQFFHVVPPGACGWLSIVLCIIQVFSPKRHPFSQGGEIPTARLLFQREAHKIFFTFLQ